MPWRRWAGGRQNSVIDAIDLMSGWGLEEGDGLPMATFRRVAEGAGKGPKILHAGGGAAICCGNSGIDGNDRAVRRRGQSGRGPKM